MRMGACIPQIFVPSNLLFTRRKQFFGLIICEGLNFKRKMLKVWIEFFKKKNRIIEILNKHLHNLNTVSVSLPTKFRFYHRARAKKKRKKN